MEWSALDAVLTRWRQGRIDSEALRSEFRASQIAPERLSSMMERALAEDDWELLQELVIVAADGPSRAFTQVLCEALTRNSPEMPNEDLVEALDRVADPLSVPALRKAADMEQVGDDVAHHFNRKCVHALARIGTPDAQEALRDLARRSPYAEVRAEAERYAGVPAVLFGSIAAWLRLVETARLEVVRQSLDDTSFGNALIELRRGDVQLRLVRDRGEWACERLDVRDGTWHDVEPLLREPDAKATARVRTELGALLDALRTRWSQVVGSQGQRAEK